MEKLVFDFLGIFLCVLSYLSQYCSMIFTIVVTGNEEGERRLVEASVERVGPKKGPQ